MFVPQNILVWIVVGGGAGLLAGVLIKGTGFGMLGDIVVGIVGALLGGFLMTLLGHAAFTGFNLWSFVVSFLGAVILLAIARMFNGGRRSLRTSA